MSEPTFKGECSECGEKVFSSQDRKMDPSTKKYRHADCAGEKKKAEEAEKGKEKIKLTLKGTVEKGKDLLALDYWSGKSDPFVKIYVGNPDDTDEDLDKNGFIDETESIMKNCNPKWDCDFSGKISLKDYEADKHVIFRIFDYNYTRGPKAMGQVSVPLKDLEFEVPDEYPVVANGDVNKHSRKMKRNGKNRFQGKLFLTLKLDGLPVKMPDVETTKEQPAPETPSSINAQAEGGQALKSQELDALAKIISVAGKLSKYGVTIDPPKIAVVGGQSAGKSTLFNVILREVGSYARFPTGGNTCTKVPTVLTLRKSEQPFVRVSGLDTPMSGSDMDKSALVKKAIKDAQRKILQDQYPGYTDDDKKFSATPVNVVAGAPRVSTEIVIVDLPGLLQSNDDHFQKVKDMVQQQIEGPNTLIVAAGKTDQDDDNDEGYGLARKVDPSGDRTMRCYTMWGNTRQQYKDKVISEIRNSSTTPSKQPHVVHLEPDSTGELVPARTSEVPKECQGTTMMVQKLGGRLGSLVRAPATTKALKDQFEAAKKKAEQQIQGLGQWSDNPDAQKEEAGALSEEYVEEPIKKMMPRIVELREAQELIQELMRECEEHSGNTVLENDVDYWAEDKTELIIFQGQRACKDIIEDKIEKWDVPIKKFGAGIDQWLAQEGTRVLEVIKQQEEPNGPLPKTVHEKLLGLWNQAKMNINQDLKKELHSNIIDSFKKTPCKTRDMSPEEREKYLHPNPMAVLCEYIQMDAQGDECQDQVTQGKKHPEVNGTESILKFLARKNPVLDLDDYEKIIGCASCREVTDKCKCEGDNRDKWENCGCSEIQPCACGKVVLDHELESVLAHRRRVLTGAKEWIGFAIGSRRVGCLGDMEQEVRRICVMSIKDRIKRFQSNIPKRIPELLIKGEDPNKEQRNDLKKQLVVIGSGLTYVGELAGDQ